MKLFNILINLKVIPEIVFTLQLTSLNVNQLLSDKPNCKITKINAVVTKGAAGN